MLETKSPERQSLVSSFKVINLVVGRKRQVVLDNNVEEGFNEISVHLSLSVTSGFYLLINFLPRRKLQSYKKSYLIISYNG